MIFIRKLSMDYEKEVIQPVTLKPNIKYVKGDKITLQKDILIYGYLFCSVQYPESTFIKCPEENWHNIGTVLLFRRKFISAIISTVKNLQKGHSFMGWLFVVKVVIIIF